MKLSTLNSQRVWEQINKWLIEFIPKHSEWVKERRLEYLQNKKAQIQHDYIKWLNELSKYNLLQYASIDSELKEIEKIDREIERYENPKVNLDGITDEMIEEAREYPIENLIEIKNGFAVCPFHNDHNPSAYCKNNYLYCFSCNTHADSIKLYMHLYSCEFQEAVKRLCS